MSTPRYTREGAGRLEVLLVHPGGPFWAKKDAGAWSIPKGGIEEGEDPLDAARREFEEETGTRPTGEAFALSPRRQPGGKIVHAWAIRGDGSSMVPVFLLHGSNERILREEAPGGHQADAPSLFEGSQHLRSGARSGRSAPRGPGLREGT
jgi:8-oxo-dGTP pyrophosphatase MutT (NUDIX family)